MRALILALLVAMPPGVHYQGTVGTGSVAWTPPTTGIARDAGASYPLSGGANTGTISSTTISGITTNTATTLIVVMVAGSTFDNTNWNPPTVAWGSVPAGASTFTRQSFHVASFNAEYVGIYTATCSQTVSSQSVVVTWPNSTLAATNAVSVDALVGASTTMGTSNSSGWEGASTANSIALAGVTAGSWLYVAAAGEVGATLSPVANTTEILEELKISDDNIYAVVGANVTGSSGNITVGWSTASSYGQVAALEIKAQ